MAVDDLYQVTFHQRVHNVPIANVFHFKQTGASSDDTVQLMVAFAEKVAAAGYMPNLGPQWEGVCIEARKIQPTQGQVKYYTTGFPITGTDTGESMPANVVATITWYSIQADKNGRGRTWISGITEENEGRNNLTQPGLTQLQNIGQALEAQLVAAAPDGTWDLHVWSQTLSLSQDVVRFEARTPLKKLRTRTPRIC